MPKKVLTTEEETLPGACGVGILYEFSVDFEEEDDYWNNPISDKQLATVGGAGWFTAGFIDAGSCKDTWNYLTKRFKLAYKTPIRRNNNSGNQFFFAIFDGQSPKAKNSKSLKWPFKENK